jgi:excisionase family DNA binding protein
VNTDHASTAGSYTTATIRTGEETRRNGDISDVVISRTTPIEQWPEFFRVEEAAAILDISRNAAYELIRRNELRAIRLGRLLRVPREVILAMRNAR